MEIITRKEAVEQGLKRYFTGKPCKHGHISERVTKGSFCVECARHSQRERLLGRRELGNSIYEIKNVAQIKIVEAWFNDRSCVVGKCLFDVLRYTNGSELFSVINMTRNEAISYVETGVMVTNRHSNKRTSCRVRLSNDLDTALRSAIELSSGVKYLFSSKLFKSNRACKDIPISRQAVHRMFNASRVNIERSLMDSGAFDEIAGFGAKSLLNFNQGDCELMTAIENVVKTYGDRISTSALSAMRSELYRIRRGQQI